MVSKTPAASTAPTAGGMDLSAGMVNKPGNPYPIAPEKRGFGSSMNDFMDSALDLPGNVWHAFTAKPQDETEQAISDMKLKSGAMDSLFQSFSPSERLALYRMVLHPMMKEKQVADAYQTLHNSLSPEEQEKEKDFGNTNSNLHKANMHRIASMVPLIGPLASDISEHYLQGDKSGAATTLLANITAGGLMDNAMKGVAGKTQKIAPTTATIAGEEVPVMAGQLKEAAPIAKKIAAEPGPQIAEQQQTAAQQGVKNVASDAAGRVMNREAEPTYAYRSRNVGEKGVPNQSHSQGGLDENEIRGYMEHRAGIEGQPQELVRVNLDKMKPEEYTLAPREGKQPWVKFNRPLQESEVEMAGQDGQFKAPEPKPTQPVESDSFADAAGNVKAKAQPTFKKLDQLSDGEFSTFQNKLKMAKAAERRATNIPDMEAAQAAKADASKGISDLLEKHADQFQPNELKNAQAMWRDMQVLDNIHGYVEKAFSAPEKVASSSKLVTRTLDGNKLIGNLNQMVNKIAPEDLTRVLGPDGLNNLYELGQITAKPEAAAALSSVIQQVAGKLTKGGVGATVGGAVAGPKGAAFGAAAGAGKDAVLRAIATNPRVADLTIKALKFGTPAKVYGPLIASEVEKANKAPKGLIEQIMDQASQ